MVLIVTFYRTVATPPSRYARRMRGRLKQSSNHLVTKNQDFIIERYPHVPQGGNWENIPKQLMSNYENVSRCHEWIYHRLAPEKPSVVIGNYRKNMLITSNRTQRPVCSRGS